MKCQSEGVYSMEREVVMRYILVYVCSTIERPTCVCLSLVVFHCVQ